MVHLLQAITAGKRVRSETSIASGAVSVSSAAAELAQLKLPTHRLADARVSCKQPRAEPPSIMYHFKKVVRSSCTLVLDWHSCTILKGLCAVLAHFQ